MPAAKGVKRAASKASTSSASTAPKTKKKRNVVNLEVPTLPKRRGCVLACGQGDVGQLGLGEDVVETNKFKHVTGLGEKIVDVCAGGMHTIAIDKDGKVWTFGCNDEGALGRPTSGETDEGTPNKVSLPLPAVCVSAGDSHSAALLNNGHVWAWGSFRDSHGSMGLVMRGREGKPCKDPVKVDIPEPAAAIASGSDHLVILTTSGAVYTMGCGEQGQLGRLSQRSASRDTRQGFSPLLIPSKVTLKTGASRVWAGYHATVILDANADKVYAWGLNNYGQLGITGEKRKTALFSPTEADAFSRVACGWVAVACGQHHSLALDDKGQVYAIGRCEYGRLGLGDRSGDAEVLEPVPALQNKKVISIAAGTSNSFAVTDAGEIFSWGMGSEGQLGTGGSSDAPAPSLAATPPALAPRAPRHVAAGGQHTVLLVEDPNAIKEASPEPEQETEEQRTEDVEEEEEEAPQPAKKPKGRATKRQKKQEQDDQEEEVSSTSSAHPSEVTEESVPQKVNGDEKKETPMEVDEIDGKEETKEKSKDENKESEKDKEDLKTETDSSSQHAVESAHSEDVEMKDADKTTKDADKPTKEADKPTKEADKPTKEAAKTEKETDSKTEAASKNTETEADAKKVEINGAPEEKTVEAKKVESIQTEQAVTTA